MTAKHVGCQGDCLSIQVHQVPSPPLIHILHSKCHGLESRKIVKHKDWQILSKRDWKVVNGKEQERNVFFPFCGRIKWEEIGFWQIFPNVISESNIVKGLHWTSFPLNPIPSTYEPKMDLQALSMCGWSSNLQTLAMPHQSIVKNDFKSSNHEKLTLDTSPLDVSYLIYIFYPTPSCHVFPLISTDSFPLCPFSFCLDLFLLCWIWILFQRKINPRKKSNRISTRILGEFWFSLMVEKVDKIKKNSQINFNSSYI